MANNFSPVGNEVQVNLSPNQNGEQFDPDIAALTDGRFFVAFTDFDAEDNIVGQFVNGDGTLSGSNINIDVGASDQFDPAVAARLGGGAIVVWDDDSVSDEIHYALVSGAGAVGGEQTILDGNDLDDARVATLADGRSLVVATQLNPTTDDIVFRFVDANGLPSVALQDFIDNGPLDQSEAAVAASGNTALVVYKEEDANAIGDIQARFFNGSSFTAEVTIADTSDLDDPDVAVLSDGRFLVSWEDGAVDGLQFRFVSAAGVPLGAVFNVADLGGDNDHPRAAPLADGGFILTWDSSAGVISPDLDPEGGAVFGRRFDAAGNPIGDIFLVNQGDNEFQGDAAVATNAAGRTFIVWEDAFEHTGAGEDAAVVGIRGRAFIPTTDVVNGTPVDDVIATYGLGETINGLEGDDLINALGGDDIVHGNAGLDRILGGLGNDQLFGDSGEDLLNGEDGDDLLVGGLGRDVQIGGLGADIFDFNAFRDSRVGANHDLIKGFRHSEHDRIDVKTIDADTTTAGNQAFDLIGNAAFSGTAGELRFSAGLLQGDTNGDGIANFEIKVTGLGAAVGGDFVL